MRNDLPVTGLVNIMNVPQGSGRHDDRRLVSGRASLPQDNGKRGQEVQPRPGRHRPPGPRQADRRLGKPDNQVDITGTTEFFFDPKTYLPGTPANPVWQPPALS